MNKIGLIVSREYFSRVKKRSFLITTLLVPIIIIGFYAAIVAITLSGSSSEKEKIAIIDNAHLFDGKMPESSSDIHFQEVKNETEQSFTGKYKDQGYSGFIFIPPFNIDSVPHLSLHSGASISISTMMGVENTLNKAIENKRMKAQGIDPEKFASISSDIDLGNIIDTKEGSKKGNAGVAYGVSFACGILIYMMMIIYGTQVMRGVTEEKTSRIAEVMVSSVKPFELMMGKILGIGAVGLTQFAIWIILLFGLQLLLPLFSPDLMHQIQTASAGSGDASSMATKVTQGFSSLPLAKIAISFLFYFLGGYLTYASLFAAIGSVVSDDQQEAQQMVFPIMMPIILGFVIMTKAVNDPNSSLAVFGSLFPLTSPIVMMGRITYDVPLWEWITSIGLLILCFIFLVWLTGRIYRTGILMYGKKPSWKEMIKWAFK